MAATLKLTATTPEGKVHELAQQGAERPADVTLRNRWFREREQAINALSAEAEAAAAALERERAVIADGRANLPPGRPAAHPLHRVRLT